MSCNRYDTHRRHFNAGPQGALLLVTADSDHGNVDGCSIDGDNEEEAASLLLPSLMPSGSRQQLGGQQARRTDFASGLGSVSRWFGGGSRPEHQAAAAAAAAAAGRGSSGAAAAGSEPGMCGCSARPCH